MSNANHLEIRDIYSEFYSDAEEVVRLVENATKFRVKNYQYIRSYRENRWDGWIRLSKRYKGSLVFPTGLVPHVLQLAFNEGLEVLVTTTREPPIAEVHPMVSGLDGVVLRDYQQQMVDSIADLRPGRSGGVSALYKLSQPVFEKVNSGVGVGSRYRLPGWGILSSATGSGKTEVSAALIGALGVRALFVVYGNDLVQQTYDRFEKRFGSWLRENNQSLGLGKEGKIDYGFVTVAGSSCLVSVLNRPDLVRQETQKWLLEMVSWEHEKLPKGEGAFRFREIDKNFFNTFQDWVRTYSKVLTTGNNKKLEKHIATFEKVDPNGFIHERCSEGVNYILGYLDKITMAIKKKEELLEFFKTIRLLIVDEVHGAGSDEFSDLLKLIPSYYKVGMSGTPLNRSDGQNLRIISSFGDPVVDITSAEMRAAGVIPSVTILFSRIGGKITFAERPHWTDIYHAGVVTYASRNYKIIRHIQQHYEEGSRILVIFKVHEHGELLSHMLWCEKDLDDNHTFIPNEVLHGEPIPHERVDGRDKSEKRLQVVEDFRSGRIKVLLASEIFGTGLDLPEIDVLINAAGGKEVIPVKQRFGRGLRGNDVLYRDYADGHHRLLAKHALNRVKIFQNEGCFDMKFEK